MPTITYQYLFPFEKVKAGARVLIYGAGVLGMEYLRQLQLSGYCEVVGMVDKEKKRSLSMAVPVYSPDEISELEFDKVIIALRTDNYLAEIKETLFLLGVTEDRIVYVGERIEENQCKETSIANIEYDFAFRKSTCAIALYMTGGFGDCVIRKKLVETLIGLIPEAYIDIYHPQAQAYLEPLYRQSLHVNALIDDAGILYKKNLSHYALGLMVETFLQVDEFCAEAFEKSHHDFVVRINKLRSKCESNRMSLAIPQFIAFQRGIYKGLNCYTTYTYGDVFPFKDKRVKIPFDAMGMEEFLGLGLNRYITVNYGNGFSVGNRFIAKQWPQTYFESLLIMIKRLYPAIEVVQLGGGESIKLQGADHYVLGKNFEVVKHILKQAIFHLDIEGGLVHLASQLGVKCVVLFGPTPLSYFGYENNINIQAGNCHGCCGLYQDISRCARDEDRPECMYSITPDLVLKKIVEYMEHMG